VAVLSLPQFEYGWIVLKRCTGPTMQILSESGHRVCVA
jgi:hypothetical protein